MPGSQKPAGFPGTFQDAEFTLNPAEDARSSTRTQVGTKFEVLFVPVVRFQTRPKWIARTAECEPHLTQLPFKKQKQLEAKKTIHPEGLRVLSSVFMWPFFKFNHQGLAEVAGKANPW